MLIRGNLLSNVLFVKLKKRLALPSPTPEVIGISSNLQTYQLEGKHTVSICMLAQYQGGEPKLMEPDKCSELRWCSPDDLPEPHFERAVILLLYGKVNVSINLN